VFQQDTHSHTSLWAKNGIVILRLSDQGWWSVREGPCKVFCAPKENVKIESACTLNQAWEGMCKKILTMKFWNREGINWSWPYILMWSVQRKRGDHGRDTLLHISRKEATTIFCLRSGHCRLRAHLKWMNQLESARCACQEADQTPEHVLLDCPLWRTQRDLAWPNGATLVKQLWGSADMADELKRTVKLIEDVGLNVWCENCRKSKTKNVKCLGTPLSQDSVSASRLDNKTHTNHSYKPLVLIRDWF
jgi:hypothetical protein